MSAQPAERIRRDCRCPNVHHEHGTAVAYNIDGCRCEQCTAAVMAYHRDLAKRRAYAGGPLQRTALSTALRLRALVAIGWDWNRLGAELGMKHQYVQYLATHETSKVTPDVRARVRAVYDRLWDVPCASRYARRSRNRAQRLDWLPPLALDDDLLAALDVHAGEVTLTAPEQGKTRMSAESLDLIDEIAVERAMQGDPVSLTVHERSEAVARLTGMGYSAREIAERLRVTTRTVQRKRAA